MTAVAHGIDSSEALKTSLALLGAAFNRPVDKAVATAYWMALRDLAPEEISYATELALQRNKFFPSAAELRALAGRKTPEQDAATAWGVVRERVIRHGYWLSAIDFGPLVNAVIRNLGGWPALTRVAHEALDVWTRKDFERVYLLLATQRPDTLRGEYLRGEVESGGKFRVAIPGARHALAKHALEGAGAFEVRELVQRLADEKART